jgi:hypothetical protein
MNVTMQYYRHQALLTNFGSIIVKLMTKDTLEMILPN